MKPGTCIQYEHCDLYFVEACIKNNFPTQAFSLQDPNRAPECDLEQCQSGDILDCYCSLDGTRVPGDMDPLQVPPMITITFNGAINSDNIDLYW